MIFNKDVIAIRYVTKVIKRWFSEPEHVLVFQVLDKRDGPLDDYGIPAWSGPRWRNATVADFTTEELE
jgi:hypothetical protein